VKIKIEVVVIAAKEFIKFNFFFKQGEWTDIRRQHRHPNYVGTPRNLHPLPPNSKILLKKGKINTKEGGLGQNPPERKQKTRVKKTT